jgi:hypothetical protein
MRRLFAHDMCIVDRGCEENGEHNKYYYLTLVLYFIGTDLALAKKKSERRVVPTQHAKLSSLPLPLSLPTSTQQCPLALPLIPLTSLGDNGRTFASQTSAEGQEDQ